MTFLNLVIRCPDHLCQKPAPVKSLGGHFTVINKHRINIRRINHLNSPLEHQGFDFLESLRACLTGTILKSPQYVCLIYQLFDMFFVLLVIFIKNTEPVPATGVRIEPFALLFITGRLEFSFFDCLFYNRRLKDTFFLLLVRKL